MHVSVVSAFVLSLVVSASSLWCADTTFRHASGFSILVPDGWKLNNQQSGVSLSKASASVSVMVLPGNGAPGDLISAVTPQIAQQWRSLNEIRHSSCTTAGVNGACAWYSGVNPKGEATNMKVASVVQEGHGYLFFIESPEQNPAAFTADLARIEQSFSFASSTKVTASSTLRPADPQKLAALDKAYQDGQITTEEYERQKQELQSGRISQAPGVRDPGQSPPANRQASARQNTPYSNEPPPPPSPQQQQNLPQQNRQPAPVPQGLGAAQGQRFVAPNRWFETSIPPGWTNLPAGARDTGAYFFAPTAGGSARLMVGSGPLFVPAIQQVVAAGILSITTMYPGLRLVDRPIYFERQGLPAAQFKLRGNLPNREPASCWYGLVLSGKRYFYVFSIANSSDAVRVEQDAQAVFRQLQF